MHDFRERLQFSEGVDLTEGILNHIYQAIPGAIEVYRANKDSDKNGTDYWVSREYELPSISIDMKNRDFCPIEKFGHDDACIETRSIYNNGDPKQIGWTLDIKKRTDLIVYTWPNGKGRRFWIVYFPILCQASRLTLSTWLAKYKELPAENDGYKTLSIYPTRVEITAAMRSLMVGVVTSPERRADHA